MLDKQTDAEKALSETEKRLKILQSWVKSGLITQSQFDTLQPIMLQKSIDSSNNNTFNFGGNQPFSTFFPSKDLITLNVGGKLYTTLKETVGNPLHLTIQENGVTKQVVEKHLLSQIFSEKSLSNDPYDKDNYLSAFDSVSRQSSYESEFNGDESSSDKSKNDSLRGLAKLDNEGHVFFDRNGEIFAYILDYLRSKGDLRKCSFPYVNPSLLKQIELEASFFNLNFLAGFLSKFKPGPVGMGPIIPPGMPLPHAIPNPSMMNNNNPKENTSSSSSPVPARESMIMSSPPVPINPAASVSFPNNPLIPVPAGAAGAANAPSVSASSMGSVPAPIMPSEISKVISMNADIRPVVGGYHFDPNHCHPDVMTSPDSLTLQVRPLKNNKYYRTCIISPELILDSKLKVDPKEINYLEVNCDTSFVCIGITSQTTEASLSGSLGGKQNKNSYAFEAYNSTNGNKKNGGKSEKFGDGIAIGTRIGLWADIAGGKLYIFKNGKNMGALFSNIEFQNQKWYFGATLALKIDKVTIIPGARHPELRK